MERLEAAMTEIDRAEERVTDTEVRTKLDSIGASLQEMLDTAAGEETDADVVLADEDVAGTAAHYDNLRSLEANLHELAEEADDSTIEEHLETAQRHLDEFRTERGMTE